MDIKSRILNIKILIYCFILTLNFLLTLLYILFEYKITIGYYLFSFIVFLMILIKNSNNLFFFIRTAFLGIIGYITLGSKLVFNDLLFGYHMRESQTFEIASIIFLSVNIALIASEIGFYMAKKVKVKEKRSLVNENTTFFWVSFVLLLMVSFILDISYGKDIVFGQGYGHKDETSFNTGLGNLNTIANLLFFFVLVLYFKFENHKSLKKYILFAGIYLFGYVYFLHGVRLDALNLIFGIIIIYMLYVKNKEVKLNFKFLILGILLFAFIQILGSVRSILGEKSLSEIYDLILIGFQVLLQDPNAGIAFRQGTLNDIATTYSGIIYMLKNSIVDYLYGSSYFDYFLRTPPSFLYPERPQDLAWIFKDYGFTSGGGFFELAEGYYNFGYFGVFIIPLFISFLFGYSYKKFIINRKRIFSMLVFLALLGNLLRGLLYQSFAFYKGIITAFILYALVLFISEFVIIFMQNNKKNFSMIGDKG